MLLLIHPAAASSDTLLEERQNLAVSIDMYGEIVTYMAEIFAYRDVCVERLPHLADRIVSAYEQWERRNDSRAEELGNTFWRKVEQMSQIDPEVRAKLATFTRDKVRAQMIASRNDFRTSLREQSESDISDACMQFYDGLHGGRIDLDRRKEAEINTLRIFSEVP